MKTQRTLTLLASILLSVACVEANELLVLIGTRQAGPGLGLSIARFDTTTGALTAPQPGIETPQPVFSVSNAAGTVVYTCHGLDTFEGKPEGFVSAFAIDQASGKLTLLNQQPIGGRGGAHVNLDRTGRFLLEASYSSGTIAVFALEPDGRIGARTALVQHEGRSVNRDRQNAPHPHAIYTDPSNRFVLVPDLGIDQVVIHRFDAATGTLAPHQPAPARLAAGTGPRHLAWHPDGRRIYVAGELTNTVIAFTWDGEAGQLTETQTISTLAPDATGKNYVAEIGVHPNGRYVYASNRGVDNSIAVFAIGQDDGVLTFVERVSSRGKFPRNFTIDPEGRWMIVSNHDSDSLAVYRIDPATGRLTPVGDTVPAVHPYGTQFLPTAKN